MSYVNSNHHNNDWFWDTTVTYSTAPVDPAVVSDHDDDDDDEDFQSVDSGVAHPWYYHSEEKEKEEEYRNDDDDDEAMEELSTTSTGYYYDYFRSVVNDDDADADDSYAAAATVAIDTNSETEYHTAAATEYCSAVTSSSLSSFHSRSSSSSSRNSSVPHPPRLPIHNNDNRPSNNHNATTTTDGTRRSRVRIIGGVHIGKMGVLVKRTSQRIVVVVDGDKPRYLQPAHVEILDDRRCTQSGIPPPVSIRPTSTTTTSAAVAAAAAISPTPVALQIGGAVLVIGGSYRGQYGTIRKETPHRIAVDIVDHTNGNSKTHYLAKQNVQPVISSSATTAPITQNHQAVPVTPIPNGETWSSPSPVGRPMPTTSTRQDQGATRQNAASIRRARPQPPPANVISGPDHLLATHHGTNDDRRDHSAIPISSLPPSSPSISSNHGPQHSFGIDFIQLVDGNSLADHERTLAHVIFPGRIRCYKFNVTKFSQKFPTYFVEPDGSRYELLSAKIRRQKQSHFAACMDVQAFFVLTLGGMGMTHHMPPINLQEELERMGNFGQLTREKVAARLELLQSPAHVRPSSQSSKQPLVYSDLFTTDDFEEIEEIAHEGCGFMPVDFAQKIYGCHAIGKRTFALQVRIVVPQLGIYKGILMAKVGIDRVQLPTSMKKVGPSAIENPEDKRVFFLIRASFPSADNAIVFPKIFQGHIEKVSKTFQETLKKKKLNEMMQRVWQDWPIPNTVIHNYVTKSCVPEQLHHTCLVGLADPTDGGIPPGTVFITGMPPMTDVVFVSRYPCTEAITDAHLLPVLHDRPPHMLESTWQWLQSLHFGGIIFGNPLVQNGHTITDSTPLPCHIANGDLDGDLYFVCWDEQILNHLRAVRTVGIPQQQQQRQALLSTVPTAQLPLLHLPTINDNWLRDGQELMSDIQRSMNITKLISKLYQLWKNKSSDDYEYFGRAFKVALDIGKHGGQVDLPSHLWAALPASLQTFLTDTSSM